MHLDGTELIIGKVMINHKILKNGFEIIEVNHDLASAKIALDGANIFEYTKVGEEPLLWLSQLSDFEPSKAIRGGVPICWPWFGMNEDETKAQHGFARTSKWKLRDSHEIDSCTTKLILILQDTKQSREIWDYKFELILEIVISDTLTLSLKTTNLDTKDMQITQALHSYFNISNISDVSIKGLEKKPYLDALSMKKEIQDNSITFSKEIDRVYQEVDKEIVLNDKTKRVSIQNFGSSSCVVWNPWIDKCSRMSAMKADAYKEFVCIETSNAFDDFVVLKPQKSHTLKATFCISPNEQKMQVE